MFSRFMETLSLKRYGPLVGIDLGARSVKLLQLSEQNGRLSVIGAARIDLVLGADSEAQSSIIRDQLRSIINSGAFTGRKCVVSLPRSDVHIQAVRLPSMSEEELAEAAAWEASQRFNIPRDQMKSDYVRTGMPVQGGENREEVLLIAASYDTLNQRLNPIVEAGFRPIAVDADFTAHARVFSRQARREADIDQVRAVIDIGYSGSTISILRGDQIAFSKSIEVGGAVFNQVIAEHLQIDETAAAELRTARVAMMALDGGAESSKDVAGALDPSTDRAVYDAVRPVINKLVKEVMLCLRYYGVTFRGRAPKCIILTGGDSLEPHLAETIEHTCNVDCSYDDAAGVLQRLLPQLQTKLHREPGPAACWSLAAGLSMRGLTRPGRAELPVASENAKEVAA